MTIPTWFNWQIPIGFDLSLLNCLKIIASCHYEPSPCALNALFTLLPKLCLQHFTFYEMSMSQENPFDIYTSLQLLFFDALQYGIICRLSVPKIFPCISRLPYTHACMQEGFIEGIATMK